MAEHSLYYFPYASLTDDQLPLLKAAALYFDRLYILDPVGASWETIGTEWYAREAVQLLSGAGILERVSPARVLADFERPISVAIRQDMADAGYLELCDAHARKSGKQRWTLSLAKVPQDIAADGAMRELLGNLVRDVAARTARATEDYIEHAEALSYLPGNTASYPISLHDRVSEYGRYAETGQAYDEYREGYEDDVEYRYVDLPLALGEAIMVNHALFGGLLHVDATPVTDDDFHSNVLAHKLRRATEEPMLAEVVAGRRGRRSKSDLLAIAALTDSEIQLPVLDPRLPMAEVLEYRQKHDAELGVARQKLGQMARRIRGDPGTQDLAEDIEHQALPDIAEQLAKAAKARDAWLRSKRGRLALSATGIAAGTAVAVLSLLVAPLTPIAVATAGLGLVSGTAVPGLQTVLDWREGRSSAEESGLHYFLKT